MPATVGARCHLCSAAVLLIRDGRAVACPHCDAPCQRGGGCRQCVSVGRANPEHRG